jgi:hypothetical protein
VFVPRGGDADSLAGMDVDSGLLIDDAGRRAADPKYEGHMCRSCAQHLNYSTHGAKLERKYFREHKKYMKTFDYAEPPPPVPPADTDDEDPDSDDELDDVEDAGDLEPAVDHDPLDFDEDDDALDDDDEPAARKRPKKKRLGLPPCALADHLWPGFVPAELDDLSRVEKSMISIFNCVTSYGLMSHTSASNYALRKKTLFTVVQKVAEIVKVLPREPSLSTTCMLGHNGVSDTSDLSFKFRPKKVRAPARTLYNLIHRCSTLWTGS